MLGFFPCNATLGNLITLYHHVFTLIRLFGKKEQRKFAAKKETCAHVCHCSSRVHQSVCSTKLLVIHMWKPWEVRGVWVLAGTGTESHDKFRKTLLGNLAFQRFQGRWMYIDWWWMMYHLGYCPRVVLVVLIILFLFLVLLFVLLFCCLFFFFFLLLLAFTLTLTFLLVQGVWCFNDYWVQVVFGKLCDRRALWIIDCCCLDNIFFILVCQGCLLWLFFLGAWQFAAFLRIKITSACSWSTWRKSAHSSGWLSSSIVIPWHDKMWWPGS